MNEKAMKAVNGGGYYYCCCGKKFKYNCLNAFTKAIEYKSHMASCEDSLEYGNHIFKWNI